MKFSRRKNVEVDRTPTGPTRAERDVRLAETLVDAGVVSRAEVDAALVAPGGGTVADRLVARGAISDVDLAKFLSSKSGFPLLDFRDVTPAPLALMTLTPERAAELQALPIKVDDQAVTVAVVDPAPEHLNTVAAAIGRQIRVTVASRRDLQVALGSAYSATKDVGSQVKEFEARDAHAARGFAT
ncbi:hypothetical protein ABIE44_001822 [Marmoricola sp. OAE513]|uniref:GspE/PulE/PilB domain-containing protein n=1 Tax=Marmoricola sp. OAE513 TaxID=2817894 RepID=UPI003393CAEC